MGKQKEMQPTPQEPFVGVKSAHNRNRYITLILAGQSAEKRAEIPNTEKTLMWIRNSGGKNGRVLKASSNPSGRHP